MEAIPPKKAVLAAAFVLLLLAGFGAYQGWRRSASDPDAAAEASGLLPTAAPVAGAKNASALAEPAAPILTEAQIREIARQEARAAIGRPDSNAAAASSEDGPPAGEKPASPAAGTAPRAATEPTEPGRGAPTEPAPAGDRPAPPPLY